MIRIDEVDKEGAAKVSEAAPQGAKVAHLPFASIPPAPGGRRIRLRYMTQVKARPPTFAAFVSQADELPESYVRYLVGGLRDEFGLVGVPIRVNLRKRRNPYVDDR